MQRFKKSRAIALAAVAAMAVAGCSKPVLDWRNADVTDGLIYAPNANEPFSGVVTHAPDNFLLNQAPGYNKFMQEAGGDRYAVARFMQAVMGNDSPGLYCRISVRKGFVDGSATCDVPRTETTIIEAHFDGGRLSGKFVYYNPDKPDQKLIEGRFDQGQPDGTQKIYSASTGKLVKKLGWSDGTYDGDYASYNETNGKVVLEGAFAGGKRTGRWKQYTADGEHLTVKSGYDQGLFNGVAEGFDPETGKRTALVDKWVDGKIDGEKKTWDKNGTLLTDEVYADGKRVADKNVKDASHADSELPQNRVRQALSDPTTTSSSAGSAAAATSQSTPNDAAASSASSDSVDACVKGWTDAHHREAVKAGVDDAVTMAQVDEWEEWCKAGKQAPAPGN